jgi:protein-disulfide isomerase-like protein with CxxC motif
MQVTHFSDPGCPWAWSAGPAFATLRWRYGDQLQWRHVMIGLSATAEQYERRGYTPERQARGYRSFRWRGMPFTTEPRERMHGTWAMCRVVVATRRLVPEREWAVFRALQFAQFTSARRLDDVGQIEDALAWVPGIDPAALVAASLEPETEELFAADRALARSAAGGPTEFQGRSATTPEGEVRFTAPSVVFTTDDGRSLECGGFQPLEAYDVCIANLDTSLTRRERAEDVSEVLAEFPDGLTTAEVAAVMCEHLQPAARDTAEDALISAAAAGDAVRLPFGNDALWVPAGRESREIVGAGAERTAAG